MFSSIRWKFIIVYFLLIFIAMVIVGVFIVEKLENQQLSHITNTMEQHMETIINTSSYISEDNWRNVAKDIQKTINEWRLDGTETLYVIDNENVPTIIATTSKNYEKIVGQNALVYKFLDPSLILKAFQSEKKCEGIVKDNNEDTTLKHLAYPVVDEFGQVKGILYMTADLSEIYQNIDESKIILTKATLLALAITVFLGFLIASSITEPIRDVTIKAEKMAKGDFDQFVEVKSNDEIGQLASMFNYLTLKLKDTIKEIDLERSKLDTIFRYMADGVIAIDREGYIIHSNPIASNILGIDYEKLSDPNTREKITILDKNINLQRLKQENIDNLEGDETVEIGQSVYKVKYAPFKNEKNNIVGLIIVFQDITEQHRLDNMRREFVANVSHELKTPITTIKSYTETLIENQDLDEELSNRFLMVIDGECDRMARIVRDLLQLSNMDYNKTKWKKVDIDVEKILREACMKLDLSFKEKNHALVINIQEDLPNIVGDKDGIEQVILNILSNAIKYTPENGTIYIRANRVEDDVVIKIKDNGIGIPEKDRERIFERFYRVDKARSRDLGGTGLGLSIAKQIIEAHDGRIILNSEYNVGTEVDIVLPIETRV